MVDPIALSARILLNQQLTDRVLATPINPAPPRFLIPNVSFEKPAVPFSTTLQQWRTQSALDVLSRAAGRPPANPTAPAPLPGFSTSVPHMRLSLNQEVAGGGGKGADSQSKWGGERGEYRDRVIKGLASLSSALDEGWGDFYTGASLLTQVKQARYPWYWGPVQGLEQVEYMLNVTSDWYQTQKWIPPGTKKIAALNVGDAISWVREQRAQQAARVGGSPVAFFR